MSLNNTLEKIGQILPSLQIQIGESDGWLSFSDIWQTDLLDDMLMRLGDRYQSQDKHFLALSLLNQYSWMPLAAGIGAYYLDQRMLDLHPDNLLWHFDDAGSVDGLRLRDSHFYALPTEPTHSENVITLADSDTLREQFHTDINAHMQVIVELLKKRCGIGKPALWGVIEDRISGMILFAARLAGQLETCEEDVHTWANVRKPSGKSKRQIIWINHNGDQHPFMRRSSCCLFYKLPEHNYCATCPLLSTEECETRLRASLG